MRDFQLDPRLAADCHPLADVGDCHVLLLDNTDYPWLVVVPETDETEFYRLGDDLQRRLVTQINCLSRFVVQHFDVDKLNVATIGNVVAQLHLHIVGRRRDDPAWPGVVWGMPKQQGYDDAAVRRIRQQLTTFLDRQRGSDVLR